MKGYTIQNSIDLLEKAVEKIESTPAPTVDVDADDVSYDNTSSGLTADDVQAAIDELNTAIGQIDTGDNYSTTETIVGTWYDGRTIYRKVLTGLSLTTVWVDKFHTSVDISTIPIADAELIIAARGYNTSSAGSKRSLPIEIIITSEKWQLITIEDTTIDTITVDYIKAATSNSTRSKKTK